ncbi:MAG: prepilin-type N-terminal cleavage/methylation domain-containing protein [Candidatus Moranbacteria bacterium]|nr:prepilin-type N-terminal cleavage/methylation domain-containing protein [Candidatus Moranbacteria bacterium]
MKKKSTIKNVLSSTKKGFSLVESLLAVFIFSMVAVMTASTFSGLLKNYIVAKKIQRNSESAQFVMNLMAKTIRSSVLPASPVSYLNVNNIAMFDNSSAQCVIYKFDAGVLKMVSAGAADGATDISKCDAVTTPVLADSNLVPLTNAGEIDNISFSGVPSSGAVVGRIVIMAKVGGSDASEIQTAVSLRK